MFLWQVHTSSQGPEGCTTSPKKKTKARVLLSALVSPYFLLFDVGLCVCASLFGLCLIFMSRQCFPPLIACTDLNCNCSMLVLKCLDGMCSTSDQDSAFLDQHRVFLHIIAVLMRFKVFFQKPRIKKQKKRHQNQRTLKAKIPKATKAKTPKAMPQKLRGYKLQRPRKQKKKTCHNTQEGTNRKRTKKSKATKIRNQSRRSVEKSAE